MAMSTSYLTSVYNLKSPWPCNITYSQVTGPRCGHLWGSLQGSWGTGPSQAVPTQDLSGSLPGQLLSPLLGSSYPRAQLTETPPGFPLYHFPWTAHSGGSNPPSLSRPSRSAKLTTMYAAHSNFPKYHLSLHLKSLGRLPAPVGSSATCHPSRPRPSWRALLPLSLHPGAVSSHLSALLLLLMG